MAKENVGTISVDMVVNDEKFEKKVKNILKNTEKEASSSGKGIESAFGSSMKKVGAFVASAFAVSKIVDFTKSAVNAATKVQSAWTGLNSIVQGTGNSFSTAQQFITDFTKDGLISIEEAATAYKNLLSRGYDTTQIENTLTALKDSAAFGRQASYDLGEAVVGATEGLKNENSILVDNAGVTKNVAKMWEEYADSIGVSSTSLTQAQKIQAEYNGIMKETRFQVGDAATYTKTFSGQVQMLKASFTQMQVAIGKVVAPIAQLFIPIINNAINAVTNFFTKMQGVLKIFGLEMPDVVSKSSSSISDMSGDISGAGDTAVKTAKKINKAFGSVDEINVLNTSSNDSSDSSSSSGTTSTSTSAFSSIGEETSTASSEISKLEKVFESLKKKISEAWNSQPIQSFVGAMKTSVSFLFDYWKTLGTDLVTNLSGTWNNIKDNLGLTLNNMSLLWTNFWTTLQGGIETWGQPFIEGISDLFNSIWTTAIDPAIQYISSAWADFSGILLELWNEHGQPLVDNIGEFVNNVISLFQKIWDNVLEPIVTPFLETLSWLWEEHISKVVKQVGNFIGKLVNGALEIYNKFIHPIVSFLLDVLGPAWATVSNLIIGVFGSVFAVISDVISSILRTFGGLIDFITGIFTGNWKKAWNGVKDIFGGIFDSLVALVKFPINLIIDGINSFIAGINKVKVPDWVPLIGGKGINIPKIPKLAQGGWVAPNNPQLAIIGDNTREGEIVTPESKIYDQVSKAIRDSGGTGKQQLEITIYHKYEDGRTIIQKINQAQIDEGEVLLMT